MKPVFFLPRVSIIVVSIIVVVVEVVRFAVRERWEQFFKTVFPGRETLDTVINEKGTVWRGERESQTG